MSVVIVHACHTHKHMTRYSGEECRCTTIRVTAPVTQKWHFTVGTTHNSYNLNPASYIMKICKNIICDPTSRNESHGYFRLF